MIGDIYEQTKSGNRWEVIARGSKPGSWMLQRLDCSTRRITRTNDQLRLTGAWSRVGERPA